MRSVYIIYKEISCLLPEEPVSDHPVDPEYPPDLLTDVSGTQKKTKILL